MSAPERSNAPQAPQGFGAFSALYRARWASNHPRMRRLWPGDNEAQPPAPPGEPDVEPESVPVTTSGGTLRRSA